MDYVALDTVVSNLIRRRLSPKVLGQLAPYAPCITFVRSGS
ncbi:hypothetical protein [Kineosporia sp. A_224]|nr:hypothetical protein [Kineosporia sp. A_224]